MGVHVRCSGQPRQGRDSSDRHSIAASGSHIWLAARRLHQGKFIWPLAAGANLQLQRQQLDALVMGLPWQRLADGGVITVV
ncbi:MAG: IS66 family insertion sequence element accessory protein TnpB [Ramlibacter sp.]|nr:IS66 family insertion sequence element accessory protein TnpB [Ramlibacter sp.]